MSIGKNYQVWFQEKTYTSSNILELVDNELCGSIDVQWYCGDKYFIIYIDVYSRMMSITFLKDKYDFFSYLSGI